MYDPNLGQKQANDQSGVAIRNLQTQGSISNFHYSDNLARGIRLGARMMIDLIPKVIPRKKVIRTVGNDDTHSMVTINGTDPNDNVGKDGVGKIYDVTAGVYDVTVSSGPSYQTKRAEELDRIIDAANKNPQLWAITGDLIFSLLDIPIAKEFQERLQKTLPPGLQPQNPNQPAMDPQKLALQSQQQQELIQKLTQTLQQETELADKVQASEQTKLKIAEMNNATATLHHQTQLQHDSNVALLTAQMTELRAKTQQAHDLIKTVTAFQHDAIGKEHDHEIAKELSEHVAGLDAKAAADNAKLTTQQAEEASRIADRHDRNAERV